MSTRAPTDSELLRAARSDPGAFAIFYDRYETAVAGFLARRVGDPELVADLTAETFAAALHAASRYRPQAPSAAGWLIAIAHNTLMSSLRRGQVEARARRRLGIREAVAFTDDELDRVEALERDDGWLTEALASLPADQAEAIRSRVLDEREYAEIAGRLGTSELVIRKRVSRGLATLRHRLVEETQS